MSLSQEIKKEYSQINTLKEVTTAFENIASTRIQQIKDRTLSAKTFFSDLWDIYSQLRRDPSERITGDKYTARKKKGDLVVVVTSRGKLSGDIDYKIVERVLSEVDSNKIDIVSVGAHGALLLEERGVEPIQVFELPEQKEYLGEVSGIIDFIQDYSNTTVYYETYISLAKQEVKKIELLFAVKELSGEELKEQKAEEVIYKSDYIFEPSFKEVIEYMESTMLKIALSQILLESNLAQQASRFKAMHLANENAEDLKEELNREYHKIRRAEKDARLKEIIYSQQL
ncbi:MAG: F0F1 ATP synthase subunit gamma [Candidatus Spechtbacterales bacterium]|nr:F0F1 ATP synthase subunit gamma [Candidatus Spechtbacterales bacterium]